MNFQDNLIDFIFINKRRPLTETIKVFYFVHFISCLYFAYTQYDDANSLKEYFMFCCCCLSSLLCN